jgi:hypothetical protein
LLVAVEVATGAVVAVLIVRCAAASPVPKRRAAGVKQVQASR